ncbi:MAG: Maf family protein [Spirochaeta sp.]|nr:Maf family protein [Spirochaeta sp.]
MSSFDHRLVLASASPRRRELLRQVRIPHLVLPTHVAEIQQLDETPEAFVTRLAADKAHAAQQRLSMVSHTRPRYWFLGADTVVVLNRRVLGKPQDKEEAREYLSLLEGTSHDVLTGFAVLCPALMLSEIGIERSKVSFAPLNSDDIELYLSLSEWADAAGAYKIQGLAAAFVSSLQGSFPNVMGLPIHRICSILRSNQFRIGH